MDFIVIFILCFLAASKVTVQGFFTKKNVTSLSDGLFFNGLIFFFSSYAKLCSIIPYILAYIVGNVIFKFKYGKTIKARLELEKEELRKQLQNEELGIK